MSGWTYHIWYDIKKVPIIYSLSGSYILFPINKTWKIYDIFPLRLLIRIKTYWDIWSISSRLGRINTSHITFLYIVLDLILSNFEHGRNGLPSRLLILCASYRTTEGVSEKDLVALRRALTRRFWMLPNPFLKRPFGSQAHAHQSHKAEFDWRWAGCFNVQLNDHIVGSDRLLGCMWM